MKKINSKHRVIWFVVILITISEINSQTLLEKYNSTISILNWGYNYDSTLVFLNKIKNSPNVTIDSIGRSVQGRTLWMVTIQENLEPAKLLFRVTLHARTHPSERQSQWLTQRIIEKLIENSSLAKALRKNVVFNFVPMYNPDGVELNLARQNANGVDLERNWFVFNTEPEVTALRNKFLDFMNSSIPIRIALNMHGDNSTKGYFVYHHEKGTSVPFTQDQKNFISLVRSSWPEGLFDWNYFISWIDGTPLVYPESWFWVNYKEKVMALTMEEIPISTKYDIAIEKTADALLNGIAKYLGIISSQREIETEWRHAFELRQNYPNPFNSETVISYKIAPLNLPDKSGETSVHVTLKVYDVLGREIKTLVDEYKSPGFYNSQFSIINFQLCSGIYFYKLTAGDFISVKKMIISK